MVILGVDPGLARVGYGLLEKPTKTREALEVVKYGCIETHPSSEAPERLLEIFKALEELVRLYSPQVIALERLFFNANVKTATAVGKTCGVVILLAAQNGIELVEYTPQEVKVAVTGFGGASKGQVQRMIMRLLTLPEIPKPDDTADALALALCHAVSVRS